MSRGALHDDDELYQVDETYLGPPGRYIAPMRHKAIFAWLVIGPLTFVTARRLGVPMTVLSVGLLLVGTVWAAMSIADHTSTERSVASLAGTFWRDVTARRPPTGRGTPGCPAAAGWLARSRTRGTRHEQVGNAAPSWLVVAGARCLADRLERPTAGR